MKLYNIYKDETQYYIKNLSSSSIGYRISFDSYNCNCITCTDCYFKLIDEGIILPNDKTSFTFKDGNYRIEIFFDESQKGEVVYLNNYTCLRQEILSVFFELFCNECARYLQEHRIKKCFEENIKKLDDYTTIFTNVLTYQFLMGFGNSKNFQYYLQKSFESYKCDIVKENCKLNSFDRFLGNKIDSFTVLGKLLGIYLVGFYLEEYFNIELEKEKEKLARLYNIKGLQDCLKYLGLDINYLSAIYQSYEHEENEDGNVDPDNPDIIIPRLILNFVEDNCCSNDNLPDIIKPLFEFYFTDKNCCKNKEDADIIYYGITNKVPTSIKEIKNHYSTTSKIFTIPQITTDFHFIAFPTTMTLLSVENNSFAGDFWYDAYNDMYIHKSIIQIDNIDYNVWCMETYVPINVGAKVIFE